MHKDIFAMGWFFIILSGLLLIFFSPIILYGIVTIFLFIGFIMGFLDLSPLEIFIEWTYPIILWSGLGFISVLSLNFLMIILISLLGIMIYYRDQIDRDLHWLEHKSTINVIFIYIKNLFYTCFSITVAIVWAFFLTILADFFVGKIFIEYYLEKQEIKQINKLKIIRANLI